MDHKITLQQVVEQADQANVTLLMLKRAIDDMDTPDIETAVAMAGKLIDSVTAWLIEEKNHREAAK